MLRQRSTNTGEKKLKHIQFPSNILSRKCNKAEDSNRNYESGLKIMGQALKYAELCEPAGTRVRIGPIRNSLQFLQTFVHAKRIIPNDPDQAILLCEKLVQTMTESHQVG